MRWIGVNCLFAFSWAQPSSFADSWDRIAHWLGFPIDNIPTSSIATESIRSLHMFRCRSGQAAPPILDEVLSIATGTDRPFERRIVPEANALIHTRVCFDPSTNETYRPFVNQPLRFKPCPLTQAEAGHVRRPSCRVPGTGLYEPCTAMATVPLTPSRFCNEKKTLDSQRKVSSKQLKTFEDVPELRIMMPEATVHPSNINHFTRDLLFAVAMARHAHRVGWRVIAAPPDPSRMIGWTSEALHALYASGWLSLPGTVERHHPTCYATATKISGDDVVSPEVVDELGCAMRAYCGASPPRGRRTFLYVARIGDEKTTRTVANLDDAVNVMRRHASGMGLEFKSVVFGGLSFCEQVKVVARAAVVFGVHGADINNALLAPPDATMIEAYPIGWGEGAEIGGHHGFGASTPTVYQTQVMRGGRRHLTARIFHVVKTRPLCNPNVNESTNWQYHADCTLRMDLPRLRDLLDLLREVLGTPPEPSRINGVPLGSRGTGV